MMRSPKSLFIMAAVGAALAVGVGFYHEPSVHADSKNAASTPQAMPVDTTTIHPEHIQLWKQFSGRVVAVEHADIRPQVDGRITKVLFEDGQYVNQGDLLMVIDPRPYEAELAQAKAELETARTQAKLAEKEYQRAKKLVETDVIPQRLLDERTNTRETARAAVHGAKAMVESARINLDYAYVKAPISGKVSRAEITVGNLVKSGPNAPLLTSIVNDDTLYVDFEIDEHTFLKSVRHSHPSDIPPIEVKLTLANGLSYTGTVHSFDNRIDPTSGTIRARAIFSNQDHVLLPGMTVSIHMGSATTQQSITITEHAIGTDQDRKFVYVIDEQGKASYREVKIGDSINGKRIILSGLQEGDVVITEGIVRIRPGMAVTPKTTEQTAANTDQLRSLKE